jgi:beta-lactam-binding protein with PASTA domain
MALQTAAGGTPLLTIREPMMFDFSLERPGTIIAQRPEPGTDISGPLLLEFVVSRGREDQTATVPQLTGLPFNRALELISSTGINFRFTARERNPGERGETVISQTPAANTSIAINIPVQITVAYPETIADNEIFDIFRFTIPQNPYPLSMRLDAQLPSGEIQRLFTVNFIGGEFTVPYKLPVGSVLILSMLNRELHRQTVQ